MLRWSLKMNGAFTCSLAPSGKQREPLKNEACDPVGADPKGRVRGLG